MTLSSLLKGAGTQWVSRCQPPSALLELDILHKLEINSSGRIRVSRHGVVSYTDERWTGNLFASVACPGFHHR
jgi:hypothetical protein